MTLSTWPKRPLSYEVNAWVWLNELAKKEKKPVPLATVPNYVPPGQPWVKEHPGCLNRGNSGDAVREPGAFIAAGGGMCLAIDGQGVMHVLL